MMKRFSLFAGMLCLLLACNNNSQKEVTEEYYEKSVTFPDTATLEQKVDMAARVVPTPQQLDWQKLELTAFIHFCPNTFTGKEWGDGNEDPNVFNPTDLDCEQWVRELKDAGFKMVILTAKHHDGFCLWPTETTAHSVKSSSWRNGEGDVVRELRDACEKHDMKFGFYISPWDRNASSYGDSPAYNDLFVRQLCELLTNYGEVHEVWFDGANGEGPNGKKQEYNWPLFLSTIHELQPNAVTAIMGDDVRWVGNEAGLGRTTEWSATVLSPESVEGGVAANEALGIKPTADDLGSRNLLANAKQVHWYPSEVDVSIRPGWFFHEEENDKVKDGRELMKIYFQSVGMNSVLLLNIPPDRRGLLHEADVAALKEFKAMRDAAFADNRVNGDIKKVNDYTFEVEVKDGSTINCIELGEDIAKGQRVEKFIVESVTNNATTKLTEGTTIGYKRLLLFPEVSATKLRITVQECRRTPNLETLKVFRVDNPFEA